MRYARRWRMRKSAAGLRHAHLPGSDWSASIIDALDHCRVMILIFSGNANDSQQICNEVVHAVHRGVPVIPVRIEDIPPGKSLAHSMSGVHWLDALSPPLEAHLKLPAESVRTMLQLVPGRAVRRNGGRGRKDDRVGTRGHGSCVGWPAARDGVSDLPRYPRDRPKWRATRRCAVRTCRCRPGRSRERRLSGRWRGHLFLARVGPLVSICSFSGGDQNRTRGASTAGGIRAFDRTTARQVCSGLAIVVHAGTRTTGRDYVQAKEHKAQAVSLPPAGTWRATGRADAQSAEDAALENCQAFHGQPCVLVAVNETVVPPPGEGIWTGRDMPRVRYAGNFDPNHIPGQHICVSARILPGTPQRQARRRSRITRRAGSSW